MSRLKMWLALAAFSILMLPAFPAGAAAAGAEEGADEAGQGGPGRAIPEDTNPHLYHAECAARWLISVAVQPAPGQYKWWASDLETSKFCTELSEGASGIGGFFTRLYTETNNATYLKYAEGAARWIISLAEPTAPDACKWTYWEGYHVYQADKFGGVGAVGEFLLGLYQATGNATYLDYSKKAAGWIMDTATHQYGGYKWELIPGGQYNFTGWAHGVAGTCDFLRMLGEETGDATYIDFAKGGATWLIAIANTSVPGQYSWVRKETDSSCDCSWCGGTTGIVQFFVLMWQATGNATYLEYAKGGGKYMISRATVSGNDRCYIGYTNMFCHGNPSDSYVLFMLANATGNSTYLRYAEMCANHTIASGISVGADSMKWPSLFGMDYYETGITRGVSGIGVWMLKGYEVTGNERYLGYAKKAANWVESLAIETSSGAEKWNWEERRSSEDEFCTGWYYGAAGIGQFLLDMVPFWSPPVRHGVDVRGGNLTGNAEPGKKVAYSVICENTGNVDDSVSLGLSGQAPGWLVECDSNGCGLAPGKTMEAVVNVTPPAGALAGQKLTVTLKAKSAGDPSREDSVSITTIVSAVQGVSLSWAGSDGTVRPGETVSYNMDVRNTGNAADTITVNITQCPPGWGINVTYDGRNIPPGEQRGAIIDITAPKEALAGSAYKATVTATSEGNGAISGNATVMTTVDAVHGVKLKERDKAGQARPGEAATYKLTVTNTGNCVDDIRLNISGAPSGWTAKTEFDGSAVPSGGERTLELTIIPPQTATAGSSASVSVRVTSGAKSSISDGVVVRTEVLPVYGLGLSGPEDTSVLPSQTQQLEFRVINRGNRNESVLAGVNCTQGWSVKFSDRGPFVLKAFGERTLTAYVTPPQKARSGTVADVTINVRLEGNASVGAEAATRCTVLPVLGFSVSASASRATAGAGVQAPLLNLTIENTGNLQCAFTIEVVGAAREWVGGPAGNQSIGPDSGRTLEYLFTAPAGAKGEYALEFVVRTGDISKSVNVTVTVVQKKAPAERPTTTDGNFGFFGAAIIACVIAAVAIMVANSRRKKALPPEDSGGPAGRF